MGRITEFSSVLMNLLGGGKKRANQLQNKTQSNSLKKMVLPEAAGRQVCWPCRWRASHEEVLQGTRMGFLPGFDGACGGFNVPLKNIKNPQTNPDVPLFSSASFWQPLSGLVALDVFAVPIIIVGDTQGLLLARLPEVLAEL